MTVQRAGSTFVVGRVGPAQPAASPPPTKHLIDSPVGPIEIDYGPLLAQIEAQQAFQVRDTGPQTPPAPTNQEELRETVHVVLNGVMGEIERQFNKWGDQLHTVGEWISISAEEFGEVHKAFNEGYLDEIAKEIIETVACLVQTFHEIRRRKAGKTDGSYKPINTLA